MLSKLPLFGKAKISSDEFLDRLMRSEAGRQAIAASEQEVAAKRREAAATLAQATAEHAAKSKATKAKLKRSADEIAKLADALRSAQAGFRALSQQEVEDDRESTKISSRATGYLRATAPHQLIAIEHVARRAEYMARGRLNLPAQDDHPPPNRLDALALLDRAKAVRRDVARAILNPNATPADAERLLKLLAPPAELLEAPDVVRALEGPTS